MVSRRTPLTCDLCESPATAGMPTRDGHWRRMGRWWFHVRTGEWVPVIAGGGGVTVDQIGYRWRNDDGSESAATWKAPLNITISVTPAQLDTLIRLRLSITTSAAVTITPVLRYSVNSGAYTRVDAASLVARSAASAHFADDDATTQLISGGAFIAGRMDDVDGSTSSIALLNPLDRTEVEFCFQLRSADIGVGDVVDFRVYNGTTALTNYGNTARVVVGVAVRVAAASTSTNPPTSMTIPIGASIQTDDDLYVVFTSRNHTSGDADATCTDNDSGGNAWTQVGQSSDKKLNVFWKKATSATASKTITVAGAIGSLAGGYVAFMGAASGDPTTNLTLESNASGDESMAQFTPTNANSHVVFAVGNYGNDNATSAQTCTDPGVLTEQFEQLSTGGSDCQCCACSRVQVGGPTATGAFTWAQTNGATWSAQWAVKPPAVAAGATFPGYYGAVGWL